MNKDKEDFYVELKSLIEKFSRTKKMYINSLDFYSTENGAVINLILSDLKEDEFYEDVFKSNAERHGIDKDLLNKKFYNFDNKETLYLAGMTRDLDDLKVVFKNEKNEFLKVEIEEFKNKINNED